MIGYIQGYDGECLQIVAPFSDSNLLVRREITQCSVHLEDGRFLSDDQRRKICATCNDIGDYTGNFELERYIQTFNFCDLYDYEFFSLSRKSENCVSMSVASQFITYLVNFCLVHNIGCTESLLYRAEDIGKYLYACLVNKRCCICGKKPDLHHVYAIGMGRDRKTIIHKGMEALPLCRECHTKAHSMGRESFLKHYHIFGIRLDDNLCRIWGVNAG